MSISEEKKELLKKKSNETRRLIIETVHHAGAGHVGGPMSATDLIVSLYFDVMNIRENEPNWKNRDRFILSKGHSAIALYAVLALREYFPVEEMKTFDSIDSRLQGHPDMTILPGIDMSTGSLGQGISAAVGMALAAKLSGEDYYTYCMIGDGESQEGQVWEAADTASKYELDNLIVILDYNKLQQYGWTRSDNNREIPITSPQTRFEAFGWNVIEMDGHDYEAIIEACKEAKKVKGKPTVLVAHTVKGKGISFMENDYLWHSRVPTDEELENGIKELEEASK
ncbi:transketolase [Priestia endophytica]|uniref:transketolase n=1 Tax=Priestia endophytica TaxID=135735 RepID=UPI000DCA6727|nr:transketolase [Priestia endophytica]RAS86364.1 transketolase [Priestia endophytica]